MPTGDIAMAALIARAGAEQPSIKTRRPRIRAIDEPGRESNDATGSTAKNQIGEVEDHVR
jgi:hypothetical protein